MLVWFIIFAHPPLGTIRKLRFEINTALYNIINGFVKENI